MYSDKGKRIVAGNLHFAAMCPESNQSAWLLELNVRKVQAGPVFRNPLLAGGAQAAVWDWARVTGPVHLTF